MGRLASLLLGIVGAVLALLASDALALLPALTTRAAEAESSGWFLLLNVPFRSQLDGSPAAGANCGVASLGMVLEAYGIQVTTGQLRERADELRGSTNPDEGVALDHLQQIAEEAGLLVVGLRDGGQYARWTTDDLRSHLEQGHPVITLVHYRSLPGNEQVQTSTDHYIVVVGFSSEGFIVNDPANPGDSGRRRSLSDSQLQQAWDGASVPGHAIAVLPGEAHQPVAEARLLASELAAEGAPLAFGPAQIPLAPSAPAPSPSPKADASAAVAGGAKRALTAPTRSAGQWARGSSQPAATPDLWANGSPRAGDSGAATGEPPARAAGGSSGSANHLYALGIVLGAVLMGALLLGRR